MKPSLSIVIPVYNEEQNLPELLRRVVESCRALGCVFEIVFVNDGSKDRSAEILAEAARQNPREIIAVLLNRNYGQHNAIFAGYGVSRGDLSSTSTPTSRIRPRKSTKSTSSSARATTWSRACACRARIPRCGRSPRGS